MSNDPSEQRDRQLVDRIRADDHEAFETLFRKYADRLCTFAAEYVGDGAAEDIVQTVFCDVWERRGELSPKESVKAYLYRAVRNTSLDRLKHRDVKQEWEKEEKKRSSHDWNKPVEDLQHQELRRAMKRAVAELPERRRMIYQMARLHGMTYAEIACALDISTKTVENQMGRALKTLRDKLEKFAMFLQ
jgi:RNA polymerase sigma-70 factor (ECF subfamily)